MNEFRTKVIFDDSLEHYGILGMKWGIRRTPAQLGHKVIGIKKSTKSEDRTKVENLLKKKPSELSNEDLNNVINRLLKEKQVMDLTKKPPSAIKKFLKAAAKSTGKVAFVSLGLIGLRKIAAKYDKDTTDKAVNINIIIKEIERELRQLG